MEQHQSEEDNMKPSKEYISTLKDELSELLKIRKKVARKIGIIQKGIDKGVEVIYPVMYVLSELKNNMNLIDQKIMFFNKLIESIEEYPKGVTTKNIAEIKKNIRKEIKDTINGPLKTLMRVDKDIFQGDMFKLKYRVPNPRRTRLSASFMTSTIRV